MFERLHTLDVLVLVVYMLAMLGMGIFFSRETVDTEGYFVGNRSFKGWVIGLSMVATSISSVTFVAYPADAYKTAYLRFLPNLMLPIAVLVAAYLFLPFFRRGRITSAYEYLESRFGPSIRVYAAVAFIVGQLFRLSIVLYLLALVAVEVTGVSLTACIVISGLVTAACTVTGGIKGVIWTDVVQTIVFMLGGLLCLGVIVVRLPGGLEQIFTVGLTEGKFAFSDLVGGTLRPVSWSLSLSEKTATMMLLIGLTAWLAEYSGNQNVIQKYCASSSPREARKAMLVCVVTCLPIWFFFMFLGTSLFVFYQAFPSVEAGEMLTGIRPAEQILPHFIVHELPPGITGIVIAAILAAAVSTLDSGVNAISTVGIVDIYRRHLVKGRADRHYLHVAWAIAAAVSAAMIGGAMILATVETKTLQDTGTILMSLLGGGMLGMYLLGFFTRKGDARAVAVGIGATLLFTAWTLLSSHERLPQALRFPLDLYYTGLLGNLVMFTVGFLVGAALAPRGDMKNLTVWDQDPMPLE